MNSEKQEMETSPSKPSEPSPKDHIFPHPKDQDPQHPSTPPNSISSPHTTSSPNPSTSSPNPSPMDPKSKLETFTTKQAEPITAPSAPISEELLAALPTLPSPSHHPSDAQHNSLDDLDLADLAADSLFDDDFDDSPSLFEPQSPLFPVKADEVLPEEAPTADCPPRVSPPSPVPQAFEKTRQITDRDVQLFMKRRRVERGIPQVVRNKRLLKRDLSGSLVYNECGFLECCLCMGTSFRTDNCRCICHGPLVPSTIVAPISIANPAPIGVAGVTSYPAGVEASIGFGTRVPPPPAPPMPPAISGGIGDMTATARGADGAVLVPTAAARTKRAYRCSKCHQSGHRSTKCPTLTGLPVQAAGPPREKRAYACSNCKKPGHSARTCKEPCGYCKKPGHPINKCRKAIADSAVVTA